METKERFKQHINATGKVTWYFQAFRTTRRGFITKREAQLAYLEMVKEQQTKRKMVGSADKFNEISQQWFRYYRSLDEQKESTYDKREEQLRILCRWIGNKKMCDLTPDVMQDLVFTLKSKGKDGSAIGYSKNTLYSLWQVMNMIFKYCENRHILSENPLKHARMPKYRSTVNDLKQAVNKLEDKFLTTDELRSLLNYSLVHEELPLAVLFHVLFYSGCRVSEALALQPEDIDFETNELLFYKQTAVKGSAKNFRIETTKTDKSARRVVVTPLVIEKLKELITTLETLRKQFKFGNEENYLFVYLEPGKRGIPFRREYVNDHIKRCVECCGIQKAFHTHLARHTMASLVAPYCNWDVLKARLGHTDKMTSKIYRHLTADEKLKALVAFSELES